MAKSSIIKDAIILCVITLLSGLILGYVYDLTKDPIAKANEEAKQKAYKTVFEKADSFESINGFDEISDSIDKLFEEKNINSVTVDEVCYAKTGKENVGCVMTLTTSKGYGGDITLSVGIANDGTVTGMEILTINETAGLGAKAKEDSFKSQFSGKNVDEFKYTKTGKQADNEIDALSGATITTTAVTECVNAAVVASKSVLKSNK